MATKKIKASIPQKHHSFYEKPEEMILRDSSLLPIKISTSQADYLDAKTVSDKYYNSFNFSKLAAKFGKMNATLGITSTGKREGKTLVAANMAVSLAKAYLKSTVLVDLNFQNPELHRIFGIDLEPGLAEAIKFHTLQIHPTKVPNLHLLAAGNIHNFPAGIEHTLILRKILHTLKNEFEFVIVDMGSVFPVNEFPVHFINEIDGLIHVIDAKKTKRNDLNRMFKHVDEKRFVGYVFNKMDR